MKLFLRRATLATGLVALLVVVWLVLPASSPVELPAGLSSDSPGMAERGAMMVRVAGCVSCHTDSANGGAPLAGGRALTTPFGTFHSPNITPDSETGIGGWSDAQFVRAVVHGEGAHGEQLYPTFPYASYAKMRLEDVLAIKAYLASLPPVRREVPPNAIAFPYSWRPLVKAWKQLFLDRAGAPATDPSQSVDWNRGRYLVEGPGHCGECHTPRGMLGATDPQRPLHGNRAGPEGWAVPALAGPRAKTFASWSVEDIDHYLKSGEKPDFDSAQGPMQEVIRDSTRFLTDADRRAMAVYLKSLSE